VCQKAIQALFFIELRGPDVDKELEIRFMQESTPMYKGLNLGDRTQRFEMKKVQDICAELDVKNFEKLNFLDLLIKSKCCDTFFIDREKPTLSTLSKKDKDRYNQLVASYKHQEYV
jgi:hypothetical protein